MKAKNILKRLVAIALSLALLAGCSSSDNEGQNDTQGRKVLNWYALGEVTTMDSVKSYDTISGTRLGFFNDTLLVLDENENAQPRLATALPEISEDGLTATFTIRDDAYFSNGEHITAENVVYAAQRTVDPATGSQSAANLEWIKNADEIIAGELPVETLGIKALDEYTIQIELKAPTPYLNNELTSLNLSPLSRDFVLRQGENYALSADALSSSGPYILKEWSGADISWKYVKNENYWNAENVYFDEINIQVVKDMATGISLYEAGQLDAVPITGEYISLWSDTPDFITIPTLRMINLEMGISSSDILQNLNVRKALSYAVDRQTMVTDVANMAGTPAVGMVPDGIATNPVTGASVAEDFGHQAEYDPRIALEYWDKALKELGTDKVTLTLETSDDDESIKIGTFLQDQFQKALPGLTIEVKNVTSQVRFDDMMSFDFDLALGGWTGNFDPTSYVQQHETNFAHNHSQWQSEELTGLVNALISEDGNDFRLRWEHLRQANQYLIDNQVTINLYQNAQNFLVNPQLKGYVTHVLGSSAIDVTYAYFE